jgi:hypothetical protein
MAKVKLVPFIAEISGTMGDFVFKKGKKEGEAILAKRPKKPKKPSKAQQAQWDRFTEASAYAREAKADPEVWAYYEAEAQKLDMQSHILAMTDYLNGKNLLSK